MLPAVELAIMQAVQGWKVGQRKVASRPLIGVEKFLNYAEHYQDGNVSLSLSSQAPQHSADTAFDRCAAFN